MKNRTPEQTAHTFPSSFRHTPGNPAHHKHTRQGHSTLRPKKTIDTVKGKINTREEPAKKHRRAASKHIPHIQKPETLPPPKPAALRK